jgi:Cu(I)/Ag(I) efflux system membrane protein CusA/SilA
MLTTGIRTPIGIKVYGTTWRDRAGGHGAGARPARVPGTRSVLFERSVGGLYVDIVPDREAWRATGCRSTT